MGTPYGSQNVSTGAIDIDSPEFAEKFRGNGMSDETDFDGGSQELPEIIRDMQPGKTRKPSAKKVQSKRELAAAQRAKEKAAAAKAKEREAKKALAEKARQERAEAREKAKAEKAAAKAAGPDVTGLVPAKVIAKAKMQNVPVDALDGIDGGDPVEKDFVENVRVHGVLQPIRVRQYTAEDGEVRYNIVYGKRRSQAARAVGLAVIPAVIEGEESANDYIQALIENFKRSHNIIEEHRMLVALQEAGYGVKQIAKATGMKLAQVSRALNVGKLRPELVAAIESGQMSSSWAAAMASRHEDVQARLVDVLADKGKITSDDVKVAMRHKQHEAVKDAADKAAGTGQGMFDVADTGDDEDEGATPVATATRTDKLAAVVNMARQSLAILQGLSAKSDDEAGAITLLEQVIENLTTPS